MNESLSISPESEICQVLTCLPEKFVVDFANGIDVAKDHIRVQSERSGFFARFYDGVTGKGARRQAEIDANLANGLEASLIWLNDLTRSLAKSNRAISQVNARVASLQNNVAEVANFSVETRQRLTALAQEIGQRCSALEQEVGRIDFEQRAERHLRQVFTKWEAGRYNGLPIAGRCFAALEELRWGDFGDFCARHRDGHKTRADFLVELRHKLVIQLSKDAAIQQDTRIAVQHWLVPQPGNVMPDGMAALAYLGDWADAALHPFVFSATQTTQPLPLTLPRICAPQRIAEAMTGEVFEGDH